MKRGEFLDETARLLESREKLKLVKLALDNRKPELAEKIGLREIKEYIEEHVELGKEIKLWNFIKGMKYNYYKPASNGSKLSSKTIEPHDGNTNS